MLSQLISSGNTKVPNTTAIFNMGTATNCPSRMLDLCKAKIGNKFICYALKAERQYPNVIPYRLRQKSYWLRIDPIDFAAEFIRLNNRKRIKFNALRFNESGDFWSQECVNKAELIANILGGYGIKVYVYTSRSDLDFSKCLNLVVLGSGFVKDGVKGQFNIIESLNDYVSYMSNNFGLCNGDCSTCTRCLNGLKSVVLVH